MRKRKRPKKPRIKKAYILPSKRAYPVHGYVCKSRIHGGEPFPEQPLGRYGIKQTS